MEQILTLDEAIQCAKGFKNFDGVSMAVSLHPEWLTTIPEDRKWAIIHHVVYSKDIEHLDRLLVPQKSNPNFRLLAESRATETILDIANILTDQGQMRQHIQRLVELDKMLNYAKSCQWDQCFEIVHANPSYGNEKPPYRRFYLVHHLACANEIEQFERFEKIRNFAFNLNLRVDRKRINAIARENNCIQFAEYIEKRYPQDFQADEINDQFFQPSDLAKEYTDRFNGLMEQRYIPQEAEWSMSPATNQYTRSEADKQMKAKLLKQQQEKAEAKKAKAVIMQHPIDTIRSILTCSLTQAIVKDPGR